MKKLLISVLIVATAIIFLRDTIKASESNQIKSSDFQSPDVCSGCHASKFEMWETSAHALAEVDPIYKAAFKESSHDTDGLTDAFCSKCHTPIGAMSGEIPPADGSNMSDIAKKGIQCDFCHTVSGIEHIGNAGYISSPGDTKRGPFEDSKSPTHETKISKLHTSADFCGMCHNVNHPVNGLKLEGTYSEWKEGPYAKEGVVCQDCHMTPGVTKHVDNPGQSSEIAEERHHVWTHYFVGGNTVLPMLYDDKERALMAEDRLKKAAAIEIKNAAAENGQLAFDVVVKNIGAGHYLPTGLTEVREMWIEITVTDSEGKTVYSSGSTDQSGAVAGSPRYFRTVLADASGKPTMKFWLAASILEDNRVPPRGEVSSPYKIPVASAKGALKVSAALNYHSMSQEEADHLLGKDMVKVPVVRMTSTETSVEMKR